MAFPLIFFIFACVLRQALIGGAIKAAVLLYSIEKDVSLS